MAVSETSELPYTELNSVELIEATTADVYFTESSSGSVRVQVLASGESVEDVVKSRPGNENGHEATAVGKHCLFVIIRHITFSVSNF